MANLLNLEVDLVFLDTTTTYLIRKILIRKKGQACANAASKVRMNGRICLGSHILCSNRGGVPIRCWVWPGITSDQQIIKTVKEDLDTGDP